MEIIHVAGSSSVLSFLKRIAVRGAYMDTYSTYYRINLIRRNKSLGCATEYIGSLPNDTHIIINCCNGGVNYLHLVCGI